MTAPASVFVALPNRGTVAAGTAMALLRTGATPIHSVTPRSTSLLTLTFNALWCAALNQSPRPSHFVMLHDDVIPCDPGWVDVLVAELGRSRADVLSACVPIKDDRGLTSTALMNPATGEMVRLTVREALGLPRTFDAAAAGRPGWAVLPNTGLWACRFAGEAWVEKVCFTARDRVFRDPADGQWKAQCYSEDWDFGAALHAMGRRACATTAVRAVHRGEFEYPNFAPWGALAADDQVNHWRPPQREYPR